MRTFCRTMVALASFCACLGLTPTPAGSAPKEWRHVLDVQGGTLTLKAPGGGNPQISLPLTGSGGECTTTVVMRETDQPKISFSRLKVIRHFTIGGTRYVAVVKHTASGIQDIGLVPGTTTSHKSVEPVAVALSIKIYEADIQEGTDCGISGLVCTLTASPQITPTWPSSIPLAPGRVVTMEMPDDANLAVVQTNPACNGALSGLNGGALKFNNMFGQVTTKTPVPVVGGGMNINLTPAAAIDLAANECISGATVTMSTSTSGTVALALVPAFTYSSTEYVLSATVSGTVSLSGTAASMTVSLTGGTIRQASADDPCASTGTSKCSVISVSSLSLTGTFSGTVSGTPLVMDGTLVLSGTATVLAFGCTAPFSALNGKTLTVTNLEIGI